MRNWSGMISDHEGSAMATDGLAIPVNSLLISRPQIEFSARDRFDSWMREESLEPLKHTEPRIYAWLIDHVRQFILMFAEDAIGDEWGRHSANATVSAVAFSREQPASRSRGRPTRRRAAA